MLREPDSPEVQAFVRANTWNRVAYELRDTFAEEIFTSIGVPVSALGLAGATEAVFASSFPWQAITYPVWCLSAAIFNTCVEMNSAHNRMIETLG